MQGSGWGVLSWEPLGQRLFIEQVYDHQGNVGQSGQLLLVLDAWEHAFYLQYENRQARVHRGDLERLQLGRRVEALRPRSRRRLRRLTPREARPLA